MCGRYTLTTPAEALEALFGFSDAQDWDEVARFNIAPQTKVLTVRTKGDARVGRALLWGAENPRDKRPLINARSETVASSPLFARAVGTARLLVPADGYFEWTVERGKRLGHYFQTPRKGPFAFAGLAITPPPASAAEEEAVVILTAAASPSMRPFHDRMPVTVAPGDYERWLDPRTDAKTALDLLQTGTTREWSEYPVGPAVNNVRNHGPECVRPASDEPDPQGTLF